MVLPHPRPSGTILPRDKSRNQTFINLCIIRISFAFIIPPMPGENLEDLHHVEEGLRKFMLKGFERFLIKLEFKIITLCYQTAPQETLRCK